MAFGRAIEVSKVPKRDSKRQGWRKGGIRTKSGPLRRRKFGAIEFGTCLELEFCLLLVLLD